MKKFLPIIKPLICFAVIIAFIITFICFSFSGKENVVAEEESILRVWQIDSFEGGKGSRADFLQKIGNDFMEISGSYVSVVALSSEAARLNFSEGIFPDIISYGAGVYGLENYIIGYESWCNGGYCFLTLDSNADFSDINSENTVINAGKENLAGAAALMCGLQSADFEKSTGAYVKLIGGNYKYLLGTQRDIYRLKTRGVSFTIKPVAVFNDLYQNISVISGGKNEKEARQFVDYLLTRRGEVSKLGLLSDGVVYEDEMRLMTDVTYEYKMTAPVSIETRKQLENNISNGDINMLKNLLK